MVNLIIVIVALGILVLIHEGGHFILARLNKVTVESFSIGFGPQLFGFTRGGTVFKIALLPLGGYVKMKAENPDEQNEDKDGFSQKKWWQKLSIAFAGPFANLLFALLIFIVTFWMGKTYEDQLPVVETAKTSHLQPQDLILGVNNAEIKSWSGIAKNIKNGKNEFEIKRNDNILTVVFDTLSTAGFYSNFEPFAPAVVGEVAPGMPAYTAGLQTGDLIVKVDTTSVSSWSKMRELIGSSAKKEITLEIERNGQRFAKTLIPQDNIMEKGKIIGITQSLPVKIEEKYSFTQGIRYGFLTTFGFIYANYEGIYKLISHPQAAKDAVGGPVMLYALSKQSAAKGWQSIFSLFAAISIILMIMNLLPIPVLDGGQIMFFLYEGIFGKPLRLKTQLLLQQIGAAIIFALIFWTLYSDFSKLVKRNLALAKTKQTLLHEFPKQ